MKQYQQRYAQEDQNMAGFAERFRNEGMQINTASLEQLETWIERILTAENLEDLLNQ